MSLNYKKGGQMPPHRGIRSALAKGKILHKMNTLLFVIMWISEHVVTAVSNPELTIIMPYVYIQIALIRKWQHHFNEMII